MACLLIVVILWVFSVCLHEFAHAWVAYRGGDYTVRDKGYLDFNPLKYAHPVYSLLMPVVFLLLGGIGLPGGAVYINHSLLRSREWETGVALAGPAANVVLSLVIAACFWSGLVPSDPKSLAAVSLGFVLLLQISSVIFNLLPVPPLDGFQAIAPWLHLSLREQLYQWSRTAPWILVLIFWNVAPVNAAFWNTNYAIVKLLGVNPELAHAGRRLFMDAIRF